MYIRFIDPSTDQTIVVETNNQPRIITAPMELDKNDKALPKQPQDAGCVFAIELKDTVCKTIVFEFDTYDHADQHKDKMHLLSYSTEPYDMTDVPCRWFYNDKIDIAVFEHENDELYNSNPVFEIRGISNQNERLSATTLTRQHCDIITAALRASNADDTGVYLIVVTYWQNGNPPESNDVPGVPYICEPYNDKMTLVSKN